MAAIRRQARVRSRSLTVPLAGLFVLALSLTHAPADTAAATAAAVDRVDVIIAFQSRPGAAEEGLVRRHGGTVKGTYRIVPAISASISSAALDALRRTAGVVRVELDGEVRTAHLSESEDPEVTSAWGVDRLDANLVWGATANATRGANVGVAIVDTGSGPHKDLPTAVARLDCLSGACVASGGADDNGHGTHVAGSALALLDNGTDGNEGVAGVAPDASLFSYKVLNSGGSGSWAGIIAALDHIVAYNQEVATAGAGIRIRVASFSLGSSTDPGQTVKAAFDNAYFTADVLIMAAAGNSGNRPGKGDNVIYPARWGSVVAVAATDKSDKRASFSSTGPAVELAAPGVSVRSAWLGQSYREASGTSMATPHATGSAALLFASGALADTNSDGTVTAQEVRERLNATAKDLGLTGRDTHFGYGLVHPERAVTGSSSHY